MQQTPPHTHTKDTRPTPHITKTTIDHPAYNRHTPTAMLRAPPTHTTNTPHTRQHANSHKAQRYGQNPPQNEHILPKTQSTPKNQNATTPRHITYDDDAAHTANLKTPTTQPQNRKPNWKHRRHTATPITPNSSYPRKPRLPTAQPTTSPTQHSHTIHHTTQPHPHKPRRAKPTQTPPTTNTPSTNHPNTPTSRGPYIIPSPSPTQPNTDHTDDTQQNAHRITDNTHNTPNTTTKPNNKTNTRPTAINQRRRNQQTTQTQPRPQPRSSPTRKTPTQTTRTSRSRQQTPPSAQLPLLRRRFKVRQSRQVPWSPPQATWPCRRQEREIRTIPRTKGR